MEKIEAEFISEYEALCHKYHLIVNACGCCPSPWILQLDDGEIADHLKDLRGENYVEPVESAADKRVHKILRGDYSGEDGSRPSSGEGNPWDFQV